MQNATPIPNLPCYLNEEYTSTNQARVSVLDRGFIFGDGVYDVVPVYARKLFRFEQHMARLSRSLEKVRIANPHDFEEWLDRCRKLVAGLPAEDQVIYIQVTRGVALRNHVMPIGIAPTVFMMVSPMKPPTSEQRRNGVACATTSDFRWQRGDIKSTSLLGNVLARQVSADRGLAETVMFRDDILTEASASNVWVVKGGKLCGPPHSHQVLEGIRYELLREICAEEGIPFALRDISRSEVMSADELLLSSASIEVLPITQLDGRPVGDGENAGRPGPVYLRLYAAYQRAKSTQSI